MQNHGNKSIGLSAWVGSTIGRKQIVGLTGAGLAGFLLTHMAGNMLIFKGPQALNEYSHALTSNPLIYAAEAGLLGMFVLHLAIALYLQFRNWRARDSHYAVMPNGAKGTSVNKRSLWAQGLLILVFVILHLATFKYGTHYTADYGKGEIRDLYKLVIEVFHEPGYVVWYIAALIVLGFHLSHGVGSVFQTFGIHHPRYQKAIRAFSIGYAILITLGFISQPIYVYFIHQG